mgnify:FL=1
MKLYSMKRIVVALGLTVICLSVHGQFTLGGISATTGVLSTLQSIGVNGAALQGAINQANRRSLRGNRPTESGQEGVDPGGLGAQPQLGVEPGRSQTGRPPMVNPIPGEGEPEIQLPEIDDPFLQEPNGGAGEPKVEEPEVGGGGGGEPKVEEPEVDDPFLQEPNGGAGEPEVEKPEIDDPFLQKPGTGSEGSGNKGEKVHTAPNGKPFPAHWGAPPAIQTRDLRPLPGGYGMGSGTLASWIQENLDRDAKNTGSGQKPPPVGAVCQVVVYGTSWCGYCTKTKDLLKSKGVSFLDKDIEKDAGARGEMEAKMAKAGLKSGGVPVIDFCGRIIKGYNEGLLTELCENQGKK